MDTLVPIVQIVVSVLLIIGILLQTSEAGLGETFGGGGFSANYHTRRGFEKTMFNGTIILAISFAVVSFIAFLIV